MSIPEPLKLIALDEDDLAVLSAHVQDAVVKIADVAWRPQEHRFAIAMNRFDWESAADDTPGRPTYRRRRAILHFDRVLSVKACQVDPKVKDAVVEVLAISFEPTETPAGFVNIVIAGGGGVRLEVECIEAYLTDLGAAWATKLCPNHDLSTVPEDLLQDG